MEALALIGLHVADRLLREVDEAESARGLSEQFAKTFAAKSQARLMQLKQELNNLKLGIKLLGEREAIQQYIARAKDLMYDLKAVGSAIEESEVALHVLQGLPSEYKVTVEALSLADELTLDGILAKLLQVEQRVEREDPTAVPIYGTRTTKKCHYCGKAGHIQAQCRIKAADQKKIPRKVVAF